MNPVSTAEKVRGLIRETFDRLGAETGEVRETILIRDGYYCGRRYHRGGLQAIWFIEENQLKFHAPDGSVLEVRSAGEEPLRKAALGRALAALLVGWVIDPPPRAAILRHQVGQ
jgi:hypothetical protein